MKKVLYIHQYFKTPSEGGAIRSYNIAKGMVAHGIQVEMITSHNDLMYKLEIVDGVKVHYLPIKYSNHFSFFRRIASFLKFILSSISICNKIEKPDLIYATSTPLTIGIIALWMKWTKKIPYVFEVRDLWPAAPIQLGIIKSALIKNLLYRFEKKIYRNSQLIIALSPGIRKGVLERYKNANVSMVPNMADVDFFVENLSNSQEKHPFTIGYFGAFGKANNIEFIINIAHTCQQENLNINFILAGDGSEKSSNELISRKNKINNIKFLGHVTRDGIRELMTQVDACITTFLKLSILETNSPNKFFDGLAAGKLSIVNTKGWIKELVEENKCGIYIDPEKPEQFSTIIRPFLEDKNLLIKYQKNALQLAKAKFEKNKLISEICDLVLNVQSSD